MIAEFYLMTTKNLNGFLQSITRAQAPDKFTTKFLEQLGYKSTTDRLFIQILKGLGLLDSNGVPTTKYFQFIDNSQSKYILADCIKEAYGDLFKINTKANEMSESDIKNKLKTIFEGKKSDDVLRLMSKTFKGLCEQADFTQTKDIVKQEPKVVTDTKYERYEEPNFDNSSLQPIVNKSISTDLHYNIQIHLPETKDIAVYDAIFESLKKHLL